MTATYIEKIKKFIDKEILSDVKMKCPCEDLMKYKLVKPNCYTGWIPMAETPQNITQNQIPCVVVGVDKKISSDSQIILSIRLTIAIYQPGFHQMKEKMSFTSEQEGYIDLQNLMDKIESKILMKKIIDDFTLISDIESAMYEEQAFPYWYGYIKFNLSYLPYPTDRYISKIS